MWDTTTNHANDQIRRLNERIAEVAADYNRMSLQRKLSLQAGDIRRARDLHKKLHSLNSNLALLAGQLRQSESVQKLV